MHLRKVTDQRFVVIEHNQQLGDVIYHRGQWEAHKLTNIRGNDTRYVGVSQDKFQAAEMLT